MLRAVRAYAPEVRADIDYVLDNSIDCMRRQWVAKSALRQTWAIPAPFGVSQVS
jgi:hypothetical protein